VSGKREVFRAEVVDPDTVLLPELEDEPPTKVTLSPVDRAPTPLWPSSDTTDALVPEALLAKLMVWPEEFDTHFGWGMKWNRSDPWAPKPLTGALPVTIRLHQRFHR
jgi:hypothetical protein